MLACPSFFKVWPRYFVYLPQGLVKPETAELQRSRYPVQARQPAKAARTVPKAPREWPSLTQILLSETTVQIVLYLGTFFTLASAFIFAGAIESLRLVILGGTTVAFLGAGVLLYFRLKQAGFVMFLIGVVMILVNAGVLVDSLNLQNFQEPPFWAAVWTVVGIMWLAGTALYRSRLFSIFWLWAWTIAAFSTGRWLDMDIFSILAMMAGTTLLGLGLSLWLRRSDPKFGLVLFVAALLQVLALQGITLMGFLVLAASGDSIAPIEWIAIGGIWLLATAFYAISAESTANFAITRLAAALSLVAAPIWILNAVNPDAVWAAAAIVIWAVGLIVWGQMLAYLPWKRIKAYSPYLYWCSVPVVLLGSLIGSQVAQAYPFGYLLLGTLLHMGSAWLNRSPLRMGMGLSFGVLTYIIFFGFEPVQDLDISAGLILWLPATGLLLAQWWIRKTRGSPRWSAPALIIGLVLAGFSVWAGLLETFNAPGQPALLFLLWGLFLIGYALLTARSWLAYAAWGSLSFALTLALVHFDIDRWMLLVTVWVLLLYGGGLAWTLLRPQKKDGEPDKAGELSESENEPEHVKPHLLWGLGTDWASSLRVSGLSLSLLAALTAPAQGDAIAVLALALYAIMFAVEGFRLKNVWYGFPTNSLLLGAWFLGLLSFDIDQPQFYSIAAAMLGLIMHYLLLRQADRHTGLSLASAIAFGTGMLSVLVLLTTTYFQFVGEGMFRWFLLLFSQSLAILAYGLVVRSRSLVIAPIGFVIFGVISAVFVFADGQLAILLLAGCGFFLLTLGVVALLARERLLKATEQVRGRAGDWRG